MARELKGHGRPRVPRNRRGRNTGTEAPDGLWVVSMPASEGFVRTLLSYTGGTRAVTLRLYSGAVFQSNADENIWSKKMAVQWSFIYMF